jgi:hypothetical protein
VPKRVHVRTWVLWLLRRTAYAARRAHLHKDRSKNWAKELDEDEIELIRWSENADTD